MFFSYFFSSAASCHIQSLPPLVGIQSSFGKEIPVGASVSFQCLKEGFSLSHPRSLNCIINSQLDYPGLTSSVLRPKLRHLDRMKKDMEPKTRERPKSVPFEDTVTQPPLEMLSSEPVCHQRPAGVCPELPYSNFQLPNLLGHTSPTQAKRYWESVAASTATNECKNALRKFLCIPLYPPCGVRPMPCKSLCLTAKQKCSDEDMSAEWKWTGALGCNLYPENDCLNVSASSNMVSATYSSTTDIDSMCLQKFQGLLKHQLKAALGVLSICENSSYNDSRIFVGAEILGKQIFKLNIELSSNLNYDCVFEIFRLIGSDYKNLTAENQELEGLCGSVKQMFLNLNSDTAETFRMKRQIETTNEDFGQQCSHPIIDFISSDIYASTGDSVTLTCSIKNECKDFNVMWELISHDMINQKAMVEQKLRNSTKFVYEGNTQKLIIENVTPMDSGYYSCKVRQNNVMREKSELLLIVNDTIQDKPKRRPINLASLVPKKTVFLSSDYGFDDWVHFNQGNGLGWRIPDKTGRTNAPLFEVCDPTAKNPKSWLRSPYIKTVAEDQMVYFEMEYSQQTCDSFFIKPILCKDYLNIMVLDTDAEVLPNATSGWNILDYTILDTIGPASNKSRISHIARIHYQPKSNGFYLALLDFGSCTMVNDLAIFVISCQQFRIGLTVFPETFAPSEKTGLKTVNGECIPGGVKLPSDNPVLWCDANGNWNGEEPASSCLCKSGYIQVGNTCMEKGPRCYACNAARSVEDCNEKSTVEQCNPDEVCGMEYVVGGALHKG